MASEADFVHNTNLSFVRSPIVTRVLSADDVDHQSSGIPFESLSRKAQQLIRQLRVPANGKCDILALSEKQLETSKDYCPVWELKLKFIEPRYSVEKSYFRFDKGDYQDFVNIVSDPITFTPWGHLSQDAQDAIQAFRAQWNTGHVVLQHEQDHFEEVKDDLPSDFTSYLSVFVLTCDGSLVRHDLVRYYKIDATEEDSAYKQISGAAWSYPPDRPFDQDTDETYAMFYEDLSPQAQAVVDNLRLSGDVVFHCERVFPVDFDDGEPSRFTSTLYVFVNTSDGSLVKHIFHREDHKDEPEEDPENEPTYCQ